MDGLAELVQNLPPEIYNEILDLTFTPRSSYHYVNAGFKPGRLFAVDRAHRTKFAKRFYGEGAIFSIQTSRIGRKWLGSLLYDHLEMIANIRLQHSSDEQDLQILTGKETNKAWREYKERFLLAQAGTIHELNTTLKLEQINLRVPYGEDERERWIGNVKELNKLRAEVVKSNKLRGNIHKSKRPVIRVDVDLTI